MTLIPFKSFSGVLYSFSFGLLFGPIHACLRCFKKLYNGKNPKIISDHNRRESGSI